LLFLQVSRSLASGSMILTLTHSYLPSFPAFISSSACYSASSPGSIYWVIQIAHQGKANAHVAFTLAHLSFMTCSYCSSIHYVGITTTSSYSNPRTPRSSNPKHSASSPLPAAQPPPSARPLAHASCSANQAVPAIASLRQWDSGRSGRSTVGSRSRGRQGEHRARWRGQRSGTGRRLGRRTWRMMRRSFRL
jgi:hypothetical protein